mmetsp:Transcript_21028/g.47162  ORF Transcript_21028/g.47162 Transcript_21028/m.47162 type:complete len:615 (+) Transcript_21028:64-1908(+)
MVGTLKVAVFSAVNLPGLKEGTTGKVKPRDMPCPTCIVKVPGANEAKSEIWRTPTCNRTTCPVWLQRRSFFVHLNLAEKKNHNPVLPFEILHIEPNQAPITIGFVEVPLDFQLGIWNHQLELKNHPGKMGKRLGQGVLSTQIQWIPESTPLSVIPPVILPASSESPVLSGVLTIDIRSASKLRTADLLSSDPYCVVSVMCGPRTDRHFTTSIRFSSLNPTWNESHSFEVNWLLEDYEEWRRNSNSHPGILIEMFDHDEFSTDDFMGEVMIPLPTKELHKPMTLPLHSNRLKSMATAKGDLTIGVTFRTFFSPEPVDEDAEEAAEACANYFGPTRVRMESHARQVAPILEFLHFPATDLLWRSLVDQVGAAMLWKASDLRRAEVVLLSNTWLLFAVALSLLSTDPAFDTDCNNVKGSLREFFPLCFPTKPEDRIGDFGAGALIAGFASAAVATIAISQVSRFFRRAVVPWKLADQYRNERLAFWSCLGSIGFTFCFLIQLASVAFLVLAASWFSTDTLQQGLIAGACSIAMRGALPVCKAVIRGWILILAKTSGVFDGLLYYYPDLIPPPTSRKMLAVVTAAEDEDDNYELGQTAEGPLLNVGLTLASMPTVAGL